MLLTEKLQLQCSDQGSDQSIESLLARFFLQRGYDLENYSTRLVASETATSPATVVRFCRTVGCKGFTDFKAQFLAELAYLDEGTMDVNPNTPFEKDDSLRAVAMKIGHLHEDAIEDTLDLLKHDDLRSARNILVRSRNIHVFSAGTSMNQAESFREKMLKIGKLVSVPSNLNYQAYEADCLDSQDVALIISYSGETKSMVSIARRCKDAGVPILALTSVGENTIANLADCRLCIATRESLFQTIGDFSTHASVNVLLDVLYSLYFQYRYDENYAHKLNATKRHEDARFSTSSILMPRESGGK